MKIPGRHFHSIAKLKKYTDDLQIFNHKQVSLKPLY